MNVTNLKVVLVVAGQERAERGRRPTQRLLEDADVGDVDGAGDVEEFNLAACCVARGVDQGDEALLRDKDDGLGGRRRRKWNVVGLEGGHAGGCRREIEATLPQLRLREEGAPGAADLAAAEALRHGHEKQYLLGDARREK